MYTQVFHVLWAHKLQTVYFWSSFTLSSLHCPYVITGHAVFRPWLYPVLYADSDENSHPQLNNVNSSTVIHPAKYVSIFIILCMLHSVKSVYQWTGLYQREMLLLCCTIIAELLWSPYGIGQTIIFLPCGFFFLSSFFLPNVSGRRLDVCHTSTHGVALVRI